MHAWLAKAVGASSAVSAHPQSIYRPTPTPRPPTDTHDHLLTTIITTAPARPPLLLPAARAVALLLLPLLLSLLLFLPATAAAAARRGAAAFALPFCRWRRAGFPAGWWHWQPSAAAQNPRPLRPLTTIMAASSSTTTTSSSGSVGSAAPVPLLPFRPDSYNGVIIDPTVAAAATAKRGGEEEVGMAPFPADVEGFAQALDASLAAWRVAGRRGVWLKLPLSLASHVPIAAARGFIFHHAERDYVMMTHWLDESTPSTLPPGPTHQVGVGALVLDATGTKVLAVQEKNGPLRGTGVWKLPTGLLDCGEDLGTGAEREVQEETGIRTRFRSLLAFRHAHGFAFGKSDLFFLARLDVVGDPTPSPCPREIDACEWIPLDELTSQPRFRASPLYSTVYDLCQAHVLGMGDEGAAAAVPLVAGAGGLEEVVSLTPIWGTRLPMGFRPGSALLYHTSQWHHEKRHQEEEEEEGDGAPEG